MLIWPLHQKLNIWLKLFPHVILVYAVCSAATVYAGPNKLVGMVGLDKHRTIGIGLLVAFVVIAITYATAYRSGVSD